MGEQCIADRERFNTHDYRDALGQYATGIAVATTRGPDGRKIGVTANSFTSVSLDPPLVSWCPSKAASHLRELESATHFAVNVLAADQHQLSRQFAAPTQDSTMQDKFEGVDIIEGLAGLPLIDGAVARFQCHTVQQIDAGDHLIFLGEVERYDANGGDPLVFHLGRYHIATRHPDL